MLYSALDEQKENPLSKKKEGMTIEEGREALERASTRSYPEPDYNSEAVRAMGEKLAKPNVDLARKIAGKLAVNKRTRSRKPGMTLRQFTGVIEEATRIIPAKKFPRD